MLGVRNAGGAVQVAESLSMEASTLDIDGLRQWIGRKMEHTERVSAAWCNRLALTLDRDANLEDGDPLPPLWHFITHQPLIATSELDIDGHAKRGEFLPPVGLPRRMWAGSRFTFHGDIHLGDEVTKVSTVDGIEMKQGRSGALCFVSVNHTLSVAGEVRITEVQDLVFREAPTNGSSLSKAASAESKEAQFGRVVKPSEILLFRYSALTFNSHRIHYDREYTTGVEGYPGLIVHGPLTATLLADLAIDETGERLSSFSFRGSAPLFDTAEFEISGSREGSDVELWASTADGSVAMTAFATLAG